MYDKGEVRLSILRSAAKKRAAAIDIQRDGDSEADESAVAPVHIGVWLIEL